MNDSKIKAFLVGFDLAGKRQSDGSLKAYLDEESLKEWPNEVSLGGNTYTLENVSLGKNGYESAQYV